ncbi:MAG TPA: nucleotidyltransferase domain-containing protein, partial [Tetrasphaera sp.]|nr:nucleotidyltransferase domain-containing protein [Tetrasphaera sp.]
AYPSRIPRGRIANLQGDLTPHPPAQRRAFQDNLWQARFLLANAHKALTRRDTAYVALCCSTAVMIAAHAWHAAAGQWVTNEKDLVPNVARLSPGSPDFSRRAGRALAHLGEDPEQLAAAIEEIEGIIKQPIPSSRS